MTVLDPPSPSAVVERQAATPQKRDIRLDVLRGIAVLLVLCNHFPVDASRAGILSRLAGPLQRFGWTGVDLFFVLSGFLVGGLLIKEMNQRGTMQVGRFWIRRGFKIWPSYYLFLLFIWSQVTLQLDKRQTLAPAFLFLQNYIAPRLCPRGHLWTLAIEEHFYLVLPVLLLLLTFRNPQRLRFLPAI